MTSQTQSFAPDAENVAAPAQGRVPMKIVVATVIGNALEFYDFIAYAFFSVYIAKAFFPAATPFTSLLLAVAVFGVGFVSRPLGGALIGAYADRAGRKPAMLLTIGLITVGTLGLALTPSYASIGVAAPLIVVLCRLVQGFALGGEIGAATAFLVEVAPPDRRGFYVSWQLASQGIAALLAGAIGTILSLILPPEALASWGWRIPFLLCVVLVPIGFYLRRDMPETLEKSQAAAAHKPGLLARHSKLITLAVLIVMGSTIATYVGQYMTTYAIVTLKLPPSISLGATVVGGVATVIFSLTGGWIADRFSRRGAMLWPRIVTALAIWPMFWWISVSPSAVSLYTATACLSALTAIGGAAAFAAIPELLPRTLRASGLAIAYALGVSLFGGTTQFIITYLIGATGDATSPAWYVALSSVIAAFAILALPDNREQALDASGCPEGPAEGEPLTCPVQK